MKLLNLASNNSFWRGIDYHHENRIIDWKELTDNCYQGKVKGSDSAVYDVTIDTAHPRKSVCNCPFAEGRRVICKHMVALDLGIFPEKEQQMMDYIEEQNLMYEQEYELEISDTTKYEDHFTNSSSLIAISKSGRSIASEDVQNFLHATERGIQVHLLCRIQTKRLLRLNGFWMFRYVKIYMNIL